MEIRNKDVSRSSTQRAENISLLDLNCVLVIDSQALHGAGEKYHGKKYVSSCNLSFIHSFDLINSWCGLVHFMIVYIFCSTLDWTLTCVLFSCCSGFRLIYWPDKIAWRKARAPATVRRPGAGPSHNTSRCLQDAGAGERGAWIVKTFIFSLRCKYGPAQITATQAVDITSIDQ